MACGWEPPDCIAAHWSPTLKGHAEKATSRAPCPLCGEARRLSYWPEGRSVRWKNHCGCKRDAVRAKLADLLPGCVSARYQPRHAVDRDEVVSLVLDKAVTINALRLGCLRAVGMTEKEAKEKLGLPRQTYYDAVRILVQSRRSRLVRILGLVRLCKVVRILVQSRRSERPEHGFPES